MLLPPPHCRSSFSTPVLPRGSCTHLVGSGLPHPHRGLAAHASLRPRTLWYLLPEGQSCVRQGCVCGGQPWILMWLLHRGAPGGSAGSCRRAEPRAVGQGLSCCRQPHLPARSSSTGTCPSAQAGPAGVALALLLPAAAVLRSVGASCSCGLCLPRAAGLHGAVASWWRSFPSLPVTCPKTLESLAAETWLTCMDEPSSKVLAHRCSVRVGTRGARHLTCGWRFWGCDNAPFLVFGRHRKPLAKLVTPLEEGRWLELSYHMPSIPFHESLRDKKQSSRFLQMVF